MKIGPLTTSARDIVSTDTDMSEAFNAYFASVFTREDLSSIPTPVITFAGGVEAELVDIQLDDNIVSKKLSLLRSDKAAGADSLHPRLLKEVQVEIKDRLKAVWLKSLDEGSYYVYTRHSSDH